MATNKLQWKRIAKGDRLPCDSLLMKKDGTIPSVVSGAGVKVGQEAYYLPVDDVIEEIRNYPIEESEDERIRKEIIDFVKSRGGFKGDWIAWLEKQGSEQHSQCNSELENVIKCLINGMRFYYEDNEEVTWGTDKWSMPVKHIIEVLEKQGEQKHQYISRPKYIGEEELLGEQKSTEWSEEDEKLINSVIGLIDDGALDRDEKDYFIEKLKSLRPQTTWKPSYVQMNALNYVVNLMASSERPTENDLYYNILKSLRQQLKKTNGR